MLLKFPVMSFLFSLTFHTIFTCYVTNLPG
nr:MAG TPA: hypothetical protein [Caudoviricetes sp.]